MCSDPTNQGSSSSDMDHLWHDALCVLNGFDWPFQVQVYAEIAPPLGGKLPARTIRISQEGVNLLKERYKLPSYNKVANTLFVPEQCIVPPASPIARPPEFIEEKQEFGETYQVLRLADDHNTGVVLWAPPVSAHYNLEVTPCKLQFVGSLKNGLSPPYAFIRTRTLLSTHTFRDRDRYPYRKLPEGGYMYRAPLHQIYRCEAINQVCRQVSQQLDQAYLEHRVLKKDYSTHYEFFYQIPENLEFNRSENSEADQELEKAISELKSWSETPDQASLDELLRKGVPLKKEKLTEGDTKDLYDNHCESSTSSNKNSGLSHENWLALFHKDDSKGNEKEHRSSTMRPSENNEPQKIILFGNCFCYGERYTKFQVDGVKKGDIIVASFIKDRDDILGTVLYVGDMPSIKPKQVFIGVAFEEPLDTEPFKVRHVNGTGDQSTCIQNCNGDFRVYVPIEILLNPDNFTRNVLRLLKGSEEKSKAKRKSLCVSDIKIDFSFEANCRDFVATPIDYVNPEKLNNMGIEGNANSCYIDAVLFALFAFTANFDEGLFQRDDKQMCNDDMSMKIKAARNVLKYDIVTPLRCSVKVHWANVYKLRIALAEILEDKSYLGNFMDSETFISSLFSRVLQVPEFFTLGEDAKDYVVQLFPPMVDEGENAGESKIHRSCVQYLLQDYCGWNGVKLQQVPNSGFLIKLPVSNGVPYYQFVYPNLKLHLGKKLLQKNDKSVKSVDLGLRAVICLKKSHFTCFVRKKAAEGENSTWYFHDSMATENGSVILTECPSLEIAIKMVASQFGIAGADQVDENEIPAEAISWIDILLTTAYICVYEPLYEETYM